MLDALDDHRHGIAAAETKRCQAALQTALLKSVEQSGQHARPRSPDGVPERDRAAIHVDAFFVKSEPLFTGEHLRGKGLIQLEKIDILERELGLLQHRLNRRNRSDEDVFRRHAAGRVSNNARQRLGAKTAYRLT